MAGLSLLSGTFLHLHCYVSSVSYGHHLRAPKGRDSVINTLFRVVTGSFILLVFL